MRVFLDLSRRPQGFLYRDSLPAALVAGLAAAGASSTDLVGAAARPWGFSAKGRARPGGQSTVTAIVLSSPHPAIQDAMRRLEAADIRASSTNGDAIDCAGAQLRACSRLPAPGQDAIALRFASPVALSLGPADRTPARRFAESLDEVDVTAALKRSAEVAAGRALDITPQVDPLALRGGAAKHLVWLRRAPSGRRIGVPGFTFPFGLRGTPDDLLYAFLAGFGAKTRQGFGLPLVAA